MSGLLNTATTLCKEIIPLQKENVLFAVSQGVFRGEFFVYMEDDADKWVFFSLPDFYIRKVSEKDFRQALDLKIVEKVETLPSGIMCIIEEQYKAVVRKGSK